MSDSGIVGIDIGGTNVVLGGFSDACPDGVWISFPTDSGRGIESAQDRFRKAIQDLAERCCCRISAIGIGGPGPLSREEGIFMNPYTLPGWEDWNIVEFMESEFRVPVSFENDADMSAYAEYMKLACGQDPMLMLTLGTGVGGSLISGGEIYRGANGEHPEFGLIPVMDAGDICYSGVTGSLESWVSGSALKKFTSMHGFPSPGDLFTCDEEEVEQTLGNVRRAWMRGIQVYIHTLYPRVIVLGGGVIDHQFEWYATAAREAIEQSALIDSENVMVIKASAGNRAGALGAAAYAERLIKK